MKSVAYSFQQLLSGGLLCCGVIVVAYLSEIFFPEWYVDAFSSSIYLTLWLVLFVGALLWTIREPSAQGLGAEITDWQFIAAFLLFASNRVFEVMPKEIHRVMDPVLSTYMLPALIIGGLVVAGIIKLSITLNRKLVVERQQTILQTQRIKELIDSPLPTQKGLLLFRSLIENKSIARFSASEISLLIEGCHTMDPIFFGWLKKQNIQPTPRDIILCVLIRMRKSKNEILSILRINDGSYRVMKSRAKKRFNIENDDWEVFLQNLK
ncbi:hypothetical protein [Bacteroides sp.]|uniref:hypothetical protein n=1 Tax=Bacteroides sp. TaxID=29523 RepID=UPI00260CF131|nr:hypothetical protein [Bacteroides sp.]MDD3038297.1 hypothetical protein [Bacteroides sp.]